MIGISIRYRRLAESLLFRRLFRKRCFVQAATDPWGRENRLRGCWGPLAAMGSIDRLHGECFFSKNACVQRARIPLGWDFCGEICALSAISAISLRIGVPGEGTR